MVGALPPRGVALLGPTGVGKSALALALCERLGGEIISVDSAQVYRGMDVGTAKADAQTRARIPHHLLDIRDPAQTYSAAEFRADAERAIAEVRGRGRLPVLVGGTLLYFRALVRGLSDLPGADATVRARLSEEAAVAGWPALHARLARLDPETAARLHPNDAQRIQRALELLEQGGVAPSTLYARNPPAAGARLFAVALVPHDRAALHERIARRLQEMLRAGFVEEVAALRARPDLHPDLPSMRALGYRQLWAFLDGAFGRAEAIERIAAATRQYAKRQLTWLRSETVDATLDPLEPAGAATVLESLCQRIGEVA